MSVKKISKIQPETFVFSKENLQQVETEIKKYPKNKQASAVISLLYIVQKHNQKLLNFRKKI